MKINGLCLVKECRENKGFISGKITQVVEKKNNKTGELKTLTRDKSFAINNYKGSKQRIVDLMFSSVGRQVILEGETTLDEFEYPKGSGKILISEKILVDNIISLVSATPSKKVNREEFQDDEIPF